MCKLQYRLSAVLTMFAAVVGQAAPPASKTPEGAGPRKPNIIFILADDLGYGDLGCYGQTKIRTPNLDKMAAEGLRFTACYAGSTVCAPSRCALMTGLHTGHARVRGNARVPLRPEDLTVAELLKKAGYSTALIGKWGLGEDGSTGVPNRKGFDEFFGYLNQNHAHNHFPDYLFRNSEKVTVPVNVVSKGVATTKTTWSQDLFLAEALSFIERKKAEPFFLYLSVVVPHANNEAGMTGVESATTEPYDDQPWPDNEKRFAASITRLDADVGQLLSKLRELGIDKDTYVFFTSDNGPHREGGHDPNFFKSGGPLTGIKRDLTEGGIRVPMLVWRPGTVPAGKTSDAVWAFWDFLPTAAAIAEVPLPAGLALDGISVLPALLGQSLPQRPPLYWEFHERGFHQAIRHQQWKAIRSNGGPVRLYDVTADIAENHNLADERPLLLAELTELFTKLRTDSPNWPIRAAKPAKK